MSNFSSYMAWGAAGYAGAMASQAATRMADLEDTIIRLGEHLIYEISNIRGTLDESLAIQNELLNRENFQRDIEEFIYQMEKAVRVAAIPNESDSVVKHFFRLSYFLNIVDREQINTSMIRGRDNKAAFDDVLGRATELALNLKTHTEVVAAISEIEREKARKKEEAKRKLQEEERRLREEEKLQRNLRQEELERKKALRKIGMILLCSVCVVLIFCMFFTSDTWLQLKADFGGADEKQKLGQKYYYGQGVAINYQEALKWFQKAAEQGSAESQYQIALMYHKGEGVAQDYSEAFKWFKNAAEQGLADAQFKLGQMYDEGDGVARDYSEAFKWFQKAAQQGHLVAQQETESLSLFMKTREKAEQGSAESQYQIALMYHKGEGIAQDYSEAFKWFQKAAEQGSAESQYRIARMYYKGEGVARDYSEAFKWFKNAAEQGHLVAQQETESLSLFMKTREKAEQGDQESQYQIALMYHKGEGVAQDYSEAFKWFKNAAEQGLADAQFKLAQMYWRGQLVCQDYSEVLKWAEKAASQGHPEAQNYLGGIYFGGLGVPQEYSKARYWFSKAAQQGHPEAQHNLGGIYFGGLGVPQDYSKAWRWFSKAAQQGYAEAQHNLGAMYYNGYGVAKDPSKAVSWLCKAAAQGNRNSIANLAEMGKTCGK